MAFFTLEDEYNTIEIICFPEVFAKYSRFLKEDEVILVSGHASISEDQEPKIICYDIKPYDSLKDIGKTLWIKIPKTLDLNIKDLEPILLANKGFMPVIIYDEAKGLKLKLNNTHWVDGSLTLLSQLEIFLDKTCIVIK